MSASEIRWTPRGDSTETSFSFTTTRGFSRLQGYANADRAQSISRGGKSLTLIHDSYGQFEVEAQAISPVNQRNLYTGITAWLEHALAGGTFALILDGSKTATTTLSGNATQSDLTLSLTSSSGMAADDWLYIEDTNDGTKFQRVQVDSVPDTVSVVVKDGLFRSFAAGSTVRHHEYFPSCVLLESSSPFRERPAGNGSELWDLQMTVRTVR